MNFRKVLSNILVSFFIFPLLMQLKYWMGSSIHRIENHDTFTEIMATKSFSASIYFILSFGILMLVFLPFQLIKDHYLKNGKKMWFIKKALLLASLLSIVIILFGSFSNIWQTPWYENLVYLAFALGFGVFFALLLYFLTDRHEERKIMQKDKKGD